MNSSHSEFILVSCKYPLTLRHFVLSEHQNSTAVVVLVLQWCGYQRICSRNALNEASPKDGGGGGRGGQDPGKNGAGIVLAVEKERAGSGIPR